MKKEIKTNRFFYATVRFLSSIASQLFFANRKKRNEIKGKKGPFVVLANHAAALDFTNLITATREPMSFVISKSFFQMLPARFIVDRLGLIPKQQFQTALEDLRKMKHTVDGGGILVIYPAGLMCEDGVSTPIPVATYKFLQWIGADIYVARSEGTYFCTPKWATGRKRRRGRTYIDIYKLFDKEELASMDVEEVRDKANAALLFDAYREQEELKIKYRGGDDIRGLENVLYTCPHCQSDYTMRVRKKKYIYCTECGFEEMADKYCFLHKTSEVGEEIRHVSDWNRLIHDKERRNIEECGGEIPVRARVQTADTKKKKYIDAGECTVTLCEKRFTLSGRLHGEEVNIEISTASFASLPFSPSRYFEIQDGDRIYRCIPNDPRVVTKFINRVKIFYEMHNHLETTAAE